MSVEGPQDAAFFGNGLLIVPTFGQPSESELETRNHAPKGVRLRRDTRELNADALITSASADVPARTSASGGSCASIKAISFEYARQMTPPVCRRPLLNLRISKTLGFRLVSETAKRSLLQSPARSSGERQAGKYPATSKASILGTNQKTYGNRDCGATKLGAVDIKNKKTRQTRGPGPNTGSCRSKMLRK
jgi:hypothetical protein